ncbi:hypothetical protein OXX69_013226, partial [Metschnikowia pulcherrima]
DSDKKSKTNVAPIVGGVVGGVAALAIGLAILFFIRRRNSKDDDDEEDFFKKGSAGSAVMMGRRRLSEGSLADEADYSRKILSVANP